MPGVLRLSKPRWAVAEGLLITSHLTPPHKSKDTSVTGCALACTFGDTVNGRQWRAKARNTAVMDPPASTRAPWAAAPGQTVSAPLPVSLNVPHAFVPHPDLASPTGAPWAAAPNAPVPVPTKLPAKLVQKICTTADLARFLDSDSAREFVAYILAINSACTGQTLSQLAANPSEAVQRLAALLTALGSWVDDIPPLQQSLRYGNPAFRLWHSRLVEQAPALLACLLPGPLQPLVQELVPYLTDSFGNPTRIDYGTGHETTFCALLFCLTKLEVLREADSAAVAGLVFAQYIRLMRRVQTTYWLEPAGSHGVWGLDDYQFLPFLWGSAQLVDHPRIRPKSIHSADVLEGYAEEFMYLGAVKFVKQVKKGPLQETSPMLCDISGVATWAKVNSGMIKMYQAEVLSKFPIMQHFLLGTLIPMPPPSSSVLCAMSAPVSPRKQESAAVWLELFSTVSTLAENIELCLQTFTPDSSIGEQKAVSAITKKRLLVKALQGLRQSKDGVQVLSEHLQALQAASQQWQKTMVFASKSHEELMEQLESTNRDLFLTTERMRTVEAQRSVAVKEADTQRHLLQQLEAERKALQGALNQRYVHSASWRSSVEDRAHQKEEGNEELDTAQFRQAELQAQVSSLLSRSEAAHASASDAEVARDRAIAALDGVRAEAAKAAANAERHQETVAKLTGDNLVFLMNLKKAEADLSAAKQECAHYKLAAEKQRGPWFDEVRANVEERVRHAMTRARALEQELESVRQQHSQELQVAEQGALGQLQGLQDRVSQLQQQVAGNQGHIQQLEAALETQQAVNKQLMAKKEEVEWQLMAAMAKFQGQGPVPLNLMVSGTLQLDRDQDPACYNNRRSNSFATQPPAPLTASMTSNTAQQSSTPAPVLPLPAPAGQAREIAAELPASTASHTAPGEASLPSTRWPSGAGGLLEAGTALLRPAAAAVTPELHAGGGATDLTPSAGPGSSELQGAGTAARAEDVSHAQPATTSPGGAQGPQGPAATSSFKSDPWCCRPEDVEQQGCSQRRDVSMQQATWHHTASAAAAYEADLASPALRPLASRRVAASVMTTPPPRH
ncbi:phosphotyrosyl phosphatase activator [Haematococcus lacustris]|uniref:peptidylprolyl isomerase n=1 Tax=Haematococcus lacustris TaxID=44745 RepID=A0A699ZAM4_HAELA|nr:phosphotyrosyl phosphatase activator [Haematococcus lacustris]